MIVVLASGCEDEPAKPKIKPNRPKERAKEKAGRAKVLRPPTIRKETRQTG